MTDTARKIVLITGANTGIGWETAKALLQSNQAYHVLLGTRSLEKGQEAIEGLKRDVPTTASTVELVEIDVASDDSITKAFKGVQATHDHLDVLINNAGISLEPKLLKKEISVREAWTQAYDVNVAGAYVMTYTFAPLLIKSSDPRLIFITSGLSTLEGMAKTYAPGPVPVPAGWPKANDYTPGAYRSSKTALNMMMLGWYWKLKEDGVKVWSVSPGFLATDLGGSKDVLAARGAGHPSIGGQLITSVVEGKRDADVGRVVAGHGIQSFWGLDRLRRLPPASLVAGPL